MRHIDIEENKTHRDPFKAPEGYFEGLAERVAERIKCGEEARRERKRQRLTRIWRWSSAACVAFAVCGGLWWMTADKGDTTDGATLFAEYATEEEWEDAVEYAMIDNEEIAYLMTENY
ncbi:MAG: hypothetical protein HUK04_01160 [Bacteroidaceae bacterium]|nr:hypothetical protein [Bacteroidaceae bacterium]